MKTTYFKKTVIWITLVQMVLAQLTQGVHAAQTVLATSPLSVQTTTVVQPNIMYVLDDSGSMAWDYTPDYVNDNESGTTSHGMCWGTTGMTKACPMSGGGGIPRDTNNSTCCNSASEASLPWYTSDINYQYYDPAIRYQPPLYANGDSYSAATRTAGTGVTAGAANPKKDYALPTAAKSDGFAGTGGLDLTTQWPHQVWCTSSTAVPTVADPTAGGKCLENNDTSSSAYFYPDYTHVYPKTYKGPPTYFVMYPAEYCSDEALTTCIRATTPTGAYTKPALFRWCSSYTPAAAGVAGTFNGCQKKRDATHIIPNYLGSWNPTGAAGAQAFANIQITSVAAGQSITGLSVGGTDILARDGSNNILVGFGNTPSNPAAPGTDLGNPVDTSANIYSTIAHGTSFPFYNSVNPQSYTTAPFDPPNPAYKYFDYQPATLSTKEDIAKALCQAVHANATVSGYDCPVTPTTDTLQVVANNIGPDTGLVVVSGPSSVTAVLSATFFDVTTATTNLKIDSMLVNLATPDQLLNPSQVVTADGNVNNTAQMLCNAINTGAKSSVYEAGSGAIAATPSYGSGACSATGPRVWVRVKNSPSASWNTKTLTLAGPATGSSYSGTLTINAVANNPGNSSIRNATKIDGITVGATSIVDATQLLTLKFSNDTLTSAQVATAVAAAINASTTKGGCSAAVSSNVVTITGTAAPCNANNVIAASSASLATSGVLRVVSVVQGASNSRQPNVATSPAQLGIDTTNGSVKVGSVKIGDNIAETVITDGTAVSTNADSIITKITTLGAGNGLTATKSCSGSGTSTVCDITVSVTDYRSTYNNLSFTPQQGGFQSGSGGTSPVWKFRIAKQDDIGDYMPIFSLKCGATNVITERTCKPTRNCVQSSYDSDDFNSNSVSTGNDNDNVGWLNNLGDSLEAQDVNGYTVSCNNAVDPGATEYVDCTVTGPVGAANCGATDGTSLRITLHDTFDSVRNPDTGSAYSEMDDAGTEYDYQDRYRITIKTDGTGGSGSSYNDFSSAVSSQTSFGSAYLAQSTTGSTLGTLATGPIVVNPNPASFAGGVDGTVVAIPTNATGVAPNDLRMAGGSNAAASNAWINIGIFKRTDIKSSVTSYTRASTRDDCVTTAGTCTYDEELQNFANWYTYYRTRMLSMKSASTLAFTRLDDKYRVGYDTIANCQSACSATVKQPLGTFADNAGCTLGTNCQRSDWWTKLTTATPTSNTPLRAETAKIGRYYSGKLTISAAQPDPIQYSCQQNFMLLVTDGYWNETEKVMPDAAGSAAGITQTDNNSTTAPRPFYDGGMTATSCATSTGSRTAACSSRTLADIAWYYYSTDLRSSTLTNSCIGGNTSCTAGSASDISTNNVPVTPDDKNTAQHMVFFGMGLGIDGLLSYRPDYALAGTGDYAEIVAGTKNWPAPKNLDPTAVDDLWHASVNGHGKYFSARNPSAVRDGLVEALNKMGQRVGSAAAAATSNLEPVSGDNFAYVASYVTDAWYGDVQSRSIDLATGAVSAATDCGASGSGCQWSAQAKLDAQTWSTRRLYLSGSGTGTTPRAFTYANLTSTEKTWFDPSASSPTPQLYQYPTLSGDATTSSYITDVNLVNYLRGDRSLEMDGNTASHVQIWRKRTHVLGDIVDTQPVFVKAPGLSYLDAGYSSFKTGASSRKPVVFISSNDGMLHALNGDTANVDISGVSVAPGEELWAYIPAESLKYMKVLADSNYDHRYFIDGQITVSDVNFGRSDDDWHTILVAGMGGGGKSYFALDITDPLAPKYLWEFTHAQLGYTFGNASINKMPNGRWAVFFSSGYNNADGVGYLFAVDPMTGSVLSDATRGTLTGSANLVTAATVITSANNTLDLNVDGPSISVTIPDGSYNQAALVQELRGLLSGAGVKVDIAGNSISFTSYTYGTTSSVTLAGGTAALDILGATPVSTAGVNGTYIFPLTTGSGSAGTPSNLGKINAWANEPVTNNTAEFIYAGDLFGDLWRFDLAPGTTGHSSTQVFKLAHLTDATTPSPGVGQPITTKPEMTRLSDGTHVVYVGTGQYLGNPDLTTTQGQAFYAIKDTLGADNLTAGAGQETWTPRVDVKSGSPMFLQRRLIDSLNDAGHTPLTKTVSGVTSTYRQICTGAASEVSSVLDGYGNYPCVNESGGTMDWTTMGGWFVDLPESRERMNVDMNLTLGTLTFATNVPHSSACTYGGSAWLNYLDYKTGLAVANTAVQVSIKVGSALIVGVNVIKLPSGSLSAIATTSDNQQLNLLPSFSPSTFSGRRTLWREFEATY